MSGSNHSVEELNRKRIQTLDQGVETFKSINELQGLSEAVLGHESGTLGIAIPGMEEVVVSLASEVTGGDLDRTREELQKRGLDDIL